MKNTLLTWDSYNNGFYVTLQTISLLYEQHDIRIQEVVYLQNDNLNEINLNEFRIFKNKKEFEAIRKKLNAKKDKAASDHIEINKHLERLEKTYKICLDLSENKLNPTVTQKRLNIRSVTHYQSIYEQVRQVLDDEDRQDRSWHVNLSPGTPQMHAVWLMLNMSGHFPEGTQLWATQRDRSKSRHAKPTLSKLDFLPRTRLHEVWSVKYDRKFGVRIEPERTMSSARQATEKQLRIFAPVPAPLLLMGDRGVGKTTYVEQIIHPESRAGEEYAKRACGTFSEELLRSELFGHKAGSFTGATKDKPGLLDRFPSGGTLFLDEIHDLGPSLQRMLMHVLDTGEYYPIGTTQPKKAVFRLVTASNLSLPELRQRLHSDFYDRISTFIVQVPPLSQCRDDIQLFWKNTWASLGYTNKGYPLPWNQSLQNYLETHPLTGNFRDLQKLAHHIVAFYHDTMRWENAITQALESLTKWNEIDTDLNQSEKENYFQPDKTYEEILLDFNRDVTLWAIRHYGSRQQALEKLKISSGSFSNYYNMKGRKNKKS